MNDIYEWILQMLKQHITTVDSLADWLFIAVNTMKAIVVNTNKEDASVVLKAADMESTDKIQQLYDMIQGRYGREGFSFRNDRRYYYLSSLVARYPKTELTDADRDKIKEFFGYDRYFMYEL